jgi:hypothetical protein
MCFCKEDTMNNENMRAIKAAKFRSLAVTNVPQY